MTAGAVERWFRAPGADARGAFTLIEVIAALVVFSIAVLLATGLTTALATQMRNASLRSEVVSGAQQRLDSVAVLPYDSVPVGTVADTVQIQGTVYLSTLIVVQIQPRIREIRVTLTPQSVPGPEYQVVSYLVASW